MNKNTFTGRSSHATAYPAAAIIADGAGRRRRPEANIDPGGGGPQALQTI